MKTPAMLHPTRKRGHGRKEGRLKRLQPSSLLQRVRAATRGRAKQGGSRQGESPGSRGSRVRNALPRVTGGAIGRLGGRRR
jgi:hypothetical protein